MGDEDAGDVDVVVQVAQPFAEFFADLGVESAEGFVEEEDLGFDGEGAGEGDALALAAGELGGVSVSVHIELHELQQGQDAAADILARGAFAARLDAQAEGDVFEDGHMAEEGVVLEDEADAALAGVERGGVLAVEVDGAAVGGIQPGDDAEEGGFAATGGTEQSDEGAGWDGEGDAVQGLEGAEGLDDVAGFDAHGVSSGRAAARSHARWARHSTMFFTTRVTSASMAKSEATAKAPAKLYSL